VAGTFDVARSGLLAGVLRRLSRATTAEGGTTSAGAIIRLTDADGRGRNPELVVQGIPAGFLHVGGALRIGPDGDLWLGTGDALDPDRTVSRDSRSGSILHYSRTGSAQRPSRHRAAIHATGFRNVQGISWQPGSGALYALDHGPSGLDTEGRRTGHDELNRIDPDVDYGWPFEAGREPTPAYRPPVLQWTEAIAPAGLDFWRGEGRWAGDAFIGALRGRDLIRIQFDGETPRCTQNLLQARFGRIRAVRMAPDGWLYFTTSNRDGRGIPASEDDRLLRVRPGP
jgi:glucose/arabinose dehydrogenase